MSKLFISLSVALLHSISALMLGGYEVLSPCNYEGWERGDTIRYTETLEMSIEVVHPMYKRLNNKTTVHRSVHLVEYTHNIIDSDSSYISGMIEFLDHRRQSTNPKFRKADKHYSMHDELFDGYLGVDGLVLNTQNSTDGHEYIRQIYTYGGLWSHVLVRFFNRSRIKFDRDTIVDFSQNDNEPLRKLDIVLDTLILKVESKGETVVLTGTMMGPPLFSGEYGATAVTFSLVFDIERQRIISGSINTTSKSIFASTESLDVPVEVEGTLMMQSMKVDFEYK